MKNIPKKCVYVHPPEHGVGSIVARYADDGPEYWSMPACIVNDVRLYTGARTEAAPFFMAAIARSVFAAWEERHV